MHHHVVVELEAELLTVGCRSDRKRLEKLLHSAFEEIGASGTLWTRQSTIEHLVNEPDTIHDPVLSDVNTFDIATNTVLVTYVLSTTNRATSRRSSLWLRMHDNWQLRFHQGTPKSQLSGE